MKLTVIHGETVIKISGKQSLKKMKEAVRDIIGYLPEAEVVEEEEPNPIGFTLGASMERAPEEVEYIWDTEEEC